MSSTVESILQQLNITKSLKKLSVEQALQSYNDFIPKHLAAHPEDQANVKHLDATNFYPQVSRLFYHFFSFHKELEHTNVLSTLLRLRAYGCAKRRFESLLLAPSQALTQAISACSSLIEKERILQGYIVDEQCKTRPTKPHTEYEKLQYTADLIFADDIMQFVRTCGLFETQSSAPAEDKKSDELYKVKTQPTGWLAANPDGNPQVTAKPTYQASATSNTKLQELQCYKDANPEHATYVAVLTGVQQALQQDQGSIIEPSHNRNRAVLRSRI